VSVITVISITARAIAKGVNCQCSGLVELEQQLFFATRPRRTVFLLRGDPLMKSGAPSRSNSIQKKAAHSEKGPARAKVWVNPKSHFKNFSEQAWKRAEVRSPKFMDIGQIDMRTKTSPPEPPKAKVAVAGESGTRTKSRGVRRRVKP
jgi:hypothetical protein